MRTRRGRRAKNGGNERGLKWTVAVCIIISHTPHQELVGESLLTARSCTCGAVTCRSFPFWQGKRPHARAGAAAVVPPVSAIHTNQSGRKNSLNFDLRFCQQRNQDGESLPSAIPTLIPPAISRAIAGRLRLLLLQLLIFCRSGLQTK